MEPTNHQIAEQLNLMSELLEIRGENVFKVRAFSRAADIISRYGSPLAPLDEKSLASIPGIGKNIAGKIREIVDTGTFRELEEIKSGIPDSLIELLRLEGIGPKTVATLWTRLSVESIDDLEREARSHRIRALRGFGEKKEESFLKAIAVYREQSGRMTRLEADAVADRVRPAFTPGTYEIAGSYRRGRSTIGDIDVVTTEPAHVINPRLRSLADEVIDEGDKRTSVRVLGKRVDVRFSRPQQFGSMLLYLTGSKAFNIRLREIAISKGFKLNEYGIEDRTAGVRREFSSEAEIFAFLSMDPVVPELREDWGEVERALTRSLPELVRQDAIRGDLHVHSSWSDGRLTIEQLARKGEELGYEYIVCSDHSATLGIAHGLDAEAVGRQSHEIELANRSSSCRIIHGIEVDILADGTLGLPSRTLGDLEIVIASVHSGFSQERDIMTRRVLSAVENDHVDIIGHPTGRILGRRQPYAIDMDRVIDRARETGTALECNASPYRLDIDDVEIRKAVGRGVRIAIGTDAHDPSEFEYMRYGVTTCRRGWASGSDVLNTLGIRDLLEWGS
ncbi:MAG: DNA polymerase/3'-5' exonuclease PolX [Methanomicrobiales archaeon]|nr:DNA polymerase/3'-5' exonuclease PolX [Methanomicrobiales archaeon]